MNAWTSESEPADSPTAAVTLVEGSSFCICAPGGDLTGSGPNGVFFRDTRILSRWRLSLDGSPVEPLAALAREPYRTTFLGRLPRQSGQTDMHLLVERDRRVGNGIREDITIRNPAPEPTAFTLSIAVEADFADLFEVKAGRVRPRGERHASAQGQRLVLGQRWRDTYRGTVVEAPGAEITAAENIGQSAGVLTYRLVVPARDEWSTSLLARPIVDGVEVETVFPLDQPVEESMPAMRLQRWQATTPMATTGPEGLRHVLRRSQQDLGALRIFEPEDPSMAAVAAGAPWFMALFGRDSLLTAYMALPVDRTLAEGTLRMVARHQGRAHNPLTEEQPGRILHEVRLGLEASLSLGGGSIYYGTVDATPLFVVVLAELARWGTDPATVRALLPHADRALEWVEQYGDRDGDGFVEYQRATDQGLRNQGWKDSWDAVNFTDGGLAEPPIALCEVQGYVYAAYLARAELAQGLGDDRTARRCLERAATLRVAFNERFWLPERGWYATALDREKKPVDACASNMGHCLWSGIADVDKAAEVARHLVSPDMFSGWGVRTLGRTMGAYNPVSYHNGSVWPHDNALIAAGLMRYGHVNEARLIAESMIEAAEVFGGRLPELFCGFERDRYPEPVPYPTSCSPQAWAAAAPVQLMRTLLRFDPHLTQDQLFVAPVLPDDFLPVRIEGVSLGSSRTNLLVTAAGAVLEGVPDAVAVRHRPYEPEQFPPSG